MIEPFAGSAAISIAAAFHGKTDRFILNDINKPLVHLLEMIISNPIAITDAYSTTWHQQAALAERYYYWIRKRFNTTQQPKDLLFCWQNVSSRPFATMPGAILTKAPISD